MDPNDIKKLRKLTSFEALVDYLRDELDWPIEADKVETTFFKYDPKELGIDPLHAVKIESIKQIRPLSDKQPWGVFYIQFENKNLPVVVLRRILHALVPASRKRDPNRKAWKMSDLLFISSQGAEKDRSVSFAHFQEVDGKPQLRTFAWDVKETHLYYIKNLNLNALRWPVDARDVDAWRRQWGEAFTVAHREVPRTAEILANKMAQIASYIREAVELTYSMEHAGESLHQLHKNLKLDLISDLSEDDFADMYAQTVTYGLFAARATRSGSFGSGDFAKRPVGSRSGNATTEVVTTAKAMIEHTNPFLRELLEQMTNQQSIDLDELGVTELTDLLGKVNMEAILQDFGRQKKGEDPVIHFYETFMREYDPQQKTKRGEFYTPDAVVSFIVRSVDHLLRTEFDCADGLATPLTPAPTALKGTSPKYDKKSLDVNQNSGVVFGGGREGAFTPVFLDPATGTGTFLRYIVMVAWETFYQKYKKLSNAQRKEKWNQYVRESLLPRLYAFELKMSPYTIAHMKVGLTLQEFGFEFRDGERLQIYLSNALQPAHEVARVDTPALAHESEQANEVKNKAPITVMIGNPPYSGHSANASRDSKGDLNFIGTLLQDYYKIDGQPLGEKQTKWLQDDYVKFLRFAQWRIKKSGKGIVAMITNHGYLDNPTFRGMRQQLMQTFDEIYVLDLHGNTKKKEFALDGSKDENVFDIQQGVAICFMVRKTAQKNPTKVFHADLFGLREFKYEWLMSHHKQMDSIEWNEIAPRTPSYLFVPQDNNLSEEYEHGWKISELFLESNVGFVSARDKFVTDFDIAKLRKRINDLRLEDKVLKTHEFAQEYGLKDTSSWNISEARKKIRKNIQWKDDFTNCVYRPFDKRHIYYSLDLLERPVYQIQKHMKIGENLGLVSPKRVETDGSWQHMFCTDAIIDHVCVSLKTVDYLFPLYLYTTPEDSAGTLFAQNTITRRANLSPNFLKSFGIVLGLEFELHDKGDLRRSFGPEDVFHYMYAVFHSPAYRSRYAEFLKIDFPRLPLTSNVELFRQLCGLGRELVALHLLEDETLKVSTARRGAGQQVHFASKGVGSQGKPLGSVVAKGYPKYQDGKVYINTESVFEGVPEDVWNFHIGGYQVCEKWLKDRRERELSAEDIAHYGKVVVSLRETIRLMGEVDGVIESAGGWPMK